MNELIGELNWLKAEKSRLEHRYYNERNEAKSKILLSKAVELSRMVNDIEYEIIKLNEKED
jgi:hypothetical protein